MGDVWWNRKAEAHTNAAAPAVACTYARSDRWMMLDWQAYLSGLAAMAGVSIATGWFIPAVREQVLRTAAAIILVWAFGILYITNTGNYDPWEFNLFIDGAAMTAILWHPAGRGQAVVGWLYILQLVYHGYYGSRELLGADNSIDLYYNVLTVIAWVQLLAVGLWCGGIWLQDRLPRHGAVRNPVGHIPPHRTGGGKV